MGGHLNKKVVVRSTEMKERVKFMIDGLPDDEPHQVIIRPYKASRSDQQNALYWMWNTVIGEELGYTKEEVHNLNRERFGIEILARISERWEKRLKKIETVKESMLRYSEIQDAAKDIHTPRFDISMMREYLNRIDQWAMSMSISLPVPKYLHLMEQDYRGGSRGK